MNNEDKLARLQAWEVEAKEHIKEIEAPGITALNAHRILELISDLHEAWANHQKLRLSAEVTYEAMDKLREELAEKNQLIGQWAKEGVVTARNILKKYDQWGNIAKLEGTGKDTG